MAIGSGIMLSPPVSAGMPIPGATANTFLYANSAGAITSTPAGNNLSAATGTGGVPATATATLAQGGTGAPLTASTGGIFYSGASAAAVLPGTATANQVLLSGSTAAPSWSTATYPAATTANQILYSSGINVVAGLATGNNGVLITSGVGVPSISSTLPAAVQSNVTAVSTTGTFQMARLGLGAAADAVHLLLLSGGTVTADTHLVDGAQTWNNNLVTFTAIKANVTDTASAAASLLLDLQVGAASKCKVDKTGLLTLASALTIANGGTGAATFTAYSVICAGTTATGPFQNVSGVGTSGQVLTSNGAGALPTWQAASTTLTTYTNVTGVSQAIVTNTGYVANNAGLVTFTLPGTAAVGDRFAVVGNGAGGWKISQNASQILHVGNTASTAGVGGYVSSTNRYDVTLWVCTVANLEFVSESVVGNVTVV